MSRNGVKKVMCQFYMEVKDIPLKNNEGFEKTFTCPCRIHTGSPITVRVHDQTIREVRRVRHS